MNVLIVAQNLFVARMLVSLAESHKSVSSYKVIVFSTTEKYILTKLHRIAKINIVCPSDVSQNVQLDSHVECIEIKRGTFSHDTVRKLQCTLVNMMESQEVDDFEYIWIFNDHTFIGSILGKNPNYAPRCIVFENSNLRNGITILGDIYGNTGAYYREFFLKKQNHRTQVPMIKSAKLYRIITLPIHIRSAKAFKYYLKRIPTRMFNIFAFFILRSLKKLLKINEGQKAAVLVALQIKDDSSIAMHMNVETYGEILVTKVQEIKNVHPSYSILVRPHPKDFTFGWLKVYRKFSRQFNDVYIDLLPLEKLKLKNISHLVTYNSNIVRHLKPNMPNCTIVNLSKQESLPMINETLYQIHEETLR